MGGARASGIESRISKMRGSVRTKGFTLVEVLLVVIILGILASMAIPTFVGRSEEARIGAAKSDIEANISTALDLFEADTGGYPTTEQGLQALIERPGGVVNWRGPYFKKAALPKDPWGRLYMYAFPGEHNPASYDLWSVGKDGADGSGDDVTNWETEEGIGQ